MEPLPEEAGFGTLFNARCIAEQMVEEVVGLLAFLLTREETVT
jgi:hypothetical protein